MTPESMIIAAVTFFLALLATWALLLPYLAVSEVTSETESAEREQRESLEIRKETAFTELEELEEDHVTRRITEREYEKSRAELAVEAGEYQRSIEELEKRPRSGAPVPLNTNRRQKQRR